MSEQVERFDWQEVSVLVPLPPEYEPHVRRAIDAERLRMRRELDERLFDK